MDLGQLLGFLLVSVTLACTPGADWAYIIASALRKTSYAPAVWGLLSGYLFHTALVVCGIATLVAGSPGMLMWLTAAGALYLLWLGIATLRSWKSAAFYEAKPGELEEVGPHHEPSPASTTTQGAASATLTESRTVAKTATAWRTPFFKGLLTSGTNPKALLLYVALIPQFLDASGMFPLALQTGILGLTHFVVSLLVYFTVALTARILLRSRPMAARVVTLCSGIIMIGLSLALLAEQFLVA